ncbi:MAG TPA: DUF6088 family protein [Bacteroidia bacterium]|nr:DUF6088 family protein [Bacteroidia bacterium]
MMYSIHSQVEKKIKSKGRGAIVFPSDLKSLGNPDAVKMALCRLAKEKVIVRLAQGIYLYPKIDPELGVLSASIESIAEAIARRDRARILPTGDFAMNRLGFSTQVPMNFVFLTDGSPRSVQIGRSTIKFKRSSPKHLTLKGKISSLVILGLESLGSQNVTPEIKQIVANALRREEPKILAHDIQLASARVARIMNETMTLMQK